MKLACLFALVALATAMPSVDMSYQYESSSMRIAGLAPAGATSGLPVFVWLAGTGDHFQTPVDVTRIEAMAARGFISVQVEYPNTIAELSCTTEEFGMKAFMEMGNGKAAKVFPAALDAVCKHPRADCTAGLAVSGHSQGAFLSLLGLQYANKRVTAVLPLGVGLPLIPELTNDELSKYLAKEKRLILTGEYDYLFVLPPPYGNGPGNEKANADLQEISGYSSAQTTFGPGYMFVPGGTHGFYGENDWAVPTSKMKCLYQDSNAVWGLESSLDWLAQTASPTKFVPVTNSAGLYTNPCIDMPLVDGPEGEELVPYVHDALSPPQSMSDCTARFGSASAFVAALPAALDLAEENAEEGNDFGSGSFGSFGSFDSFDSFAALNYEQSEAIVSSPAVRKHANSGFVYASMAAAAVGMIAIMAVAMRQRRAPTPVSANAGDSFL